GRQADQAAPGAHRLRVPELQPDRRPDGGRERRGGPDLPRRAGARAQAAGGRGARARRHRPPRQAPATAAVGRPAAARGRGPGPGLAPQADPGRRTHRQPRHRQRRGGDGPAAGRGRRRRDGGDGHPLPGPRLRRQAHHQAARRPRRVGNPARGLTSVGEARTRSLRNYISAALGNMGRNGPYAAITILGLAVSFAAAILIGLYLRDEFTFERFIPGHERVYRVAIDVALPAAKPLAMDETFSNTAANLKLDFPE